MQKRGKIPNHHRKGWAIKKAREFLIMTDTHALPVDPFSYFDRFDNWTIVSWAEAREMLGEDDPLLLRKSRAEARTAYFRNRDEYLVVYDDTITTRERIRWTIAHEIGHIVLNHLTSFDLTMVGRGGIQPDGYMVLEEEANFFAAELLQPMPVLEEIGAIEPEEIKFLCDVSSSAAEVRARDISWSRKTIYARIEAEHVVRQFSDFLDPVAYCSYDPNFYDRAPFSFKHPKVRRMYVQLDCIEVDHKNRFICCPQCGNTDFSSYAKHCKLCGMYLYNDCTNKGMPFTSYCGKANVGDARFCEYCGEETYLLRKGVLRSWRELVKTGDHVRLKIRRT